MRQVSFRDFSGGLNTAFSPFELAPNELQQCDNWMLDLRGKAVKRKGFSRYNATALGGALTGVDRYYKSDGTKILLCCAGTGIYKGADDTGVLTSIYTETYTPIAVFFANFRDLAIWVGRTAAEIYYTPHYYDGTNTGDLALAQPGAFTGGGPVAGGNVGTGTYQWRWTYYTAYGESRPSASAEGTLTGGYQQALLYWPAGPAGTQGRKLWRRARVGDGYSSWQLVVSQPGNTSTSILDNVPGSMLGDIQELQASGISGRCLALFRNRLFIAGNRTVEGAEVAKAVIWSRDSEPMSWPEANFVFVGREDGEAIEALCPLSDRLVVFKATGLYALYGDFDEQNPSYGVVEISRDVGSISPFSVATDGDVAYFLARDGVWRYDGTLTYVSNKIKDKMVALPRGKLANAAGVVYNRKYWLSVSEGGSTNDTTYVLDLIALGQGQERWTRHTFGMRCFAPCAGAGDTDYSGKIGQLMGGNDGGYLNKMDTGYLDAAAAISSALKTAPFDAGTPTERKRFRRVWLWMKAQTGSAALDSEVDFGLRTAAQTIDLTGAPAYAKAHRVVFPDKMQGMTMALKTTHAVSGQDAEVSGIELCVDERPRR